MLAQAKRLQPKAAPPPAPAKLPLKPATEPAMPMPSLFTGGAALERPSQKRQKKGCPACAEGGAACPKCQAKSAPTLERPPTGETQMRRGSPGGDPAERQADDLGKRIGDDLSGTESVGHGPLPKSVQEVAESHLGVSLEGTQIDVGSGGQRKARDESALAVTEGRNIAFGEGRLASDRQGQSLLGHELVHVAQQRNWGEATQRAETGNASGGTGGTSGRSSDEGATAGAEGASGTGHVVTLSDLKGNRQGVLDAIRALLGPGAQYTPKQPAEGAGGAPSKGPIPLTPASPQAQATTYAFSVEQAWASFGENLDLVAEENPDLWEASADDVTDVPRVAALESKFIRDVYAEGERRLDKSAQVVTREITRLEASKKKGPGKPNGAAGLDLQGAIAKIAQMRALQQQLRQVQVWDAASMVPMGTSGQPGTNSQPFDPENELPDAPPMRGVESQPPTGSPQRQLLASVDAEPDNIAADFPTQPGLQLSDEIAPSNIGPGGSPQNWSAVKRAWVATEQAISSLAEANPTAYVVASRHDITDPQKASAVTDDAALRELRATLADISEAAATIFSGNVSWVSLRPVQQAVVDTGIDEDWTSTVPAFAVAQAQKKASLSGSKQLEQFPLIGKILAQLPILPELADLAGSVANLGEQINISKIKQAEVKPSLSVVPQSDVAGAVLQAVGAALLLAAAVLTQGRSGSSYRATLQRELEAATTEKARRTLAKKMQISVEELVAMQRMVKRGIPWDAHHLVQQALETHKMAKLGRRAGWDVHSIENLWALPSKAPFSTVVGGVETTLVRHGPHAEVLAELRAFGETLYAETAAAAKAAGQVPYKYASSPEGQAFVKRQMERWRTRAAQLARRKFEQ